MTIFFSFSFFTASQNPKYYPWLCSGCALAALWLRLAALWLRVSGLRCLVLSSSTRHHITTTDFVRFCGKGKNRGKPSCPTQRQRTLAASLPSLKQRCGAPMSNRYNHHLATTVRRAVPFHTIVQEVSGPDNVRSQRRGEKGTFTARDAAIFPFVQIYISCGRARGAPWYV